MITELIPPHRILKPDEYHQLRETIGSQRDVSQLLGVDIRTVQRREAGEILITFEATRALLGLLALNYLRREVLSKTGASAKNELDTLADMLEAK